MLLTIAKTREAAIVHQQKEWVNKMWQYIQRNIIQPIKRTEAMPSEATGGHRDHYTKLKQSETSTMASPIGLYTQSLKR